MRRTRISATFGTRKSSRLSHVAEETKYVRPGPVLWGSLLIGPSGAKAHFFPAHYVGAEAPTSETFPRKKITFLRLISAGCQVDRVDPCLPSMELRPSCPALLPSSGR